MSHLKNPPVSISIRIASIVTCVTLVFSWGCAVIRIPSYRLEECAAESYCSSPTPLPQIPMPGWLARWKAQKDLPKPPEAPRFHPLPTRPMFQPQPTIGHSDGSVGESACYGTLPPAESWNTVESAPAAHVPTLASPQ